MLKFESAHGYPSHGRTVRYMATVNPVRHLELSDKGVLRTLPTELHALASTAGLEPATTALSRRSNPYLSLRCLTGPTLADGHCYFKEYHDNKCQSILCRSGSRLPLGKSETHLFKGKLRVVRSIVLVPSIVAATASNLQGIRNNAANNVL